MRRWIAAAPLHAPIADTEGRPPVSPDEFRRHAHAFVDWMADYLARVESYRFCVGQTATERRHVAAAGRPHPADGAGAAHRNTGSAVIADQFRDFT